MAYMQKGYWCIWNANGQVREGGAIHYPLHRLLYEQHHGVVLSRGVVVHHVNGDPLDNRIENLEAMTRGEHAAHHKERTTRPGERRCGMCGEWKPDAAYWRNQKRCKDCCRVSGRAWAVANREKINARRRERHQAKQAG